MSQNDLNRILYAEDDADIREIAKIALEDIGCFKVEYCTNGKEVLNKLNQFKPDLLLLDIMMPEMDGLITVQKLKQLSEFSDIPIILMTAKVQPDEISKYKSMGIIDVIIKPFDPMALSENLRAIWEKHMKS